jgi:hypothetical protein
MSDYTHRLERNALANPPASSARRVERAQERAQGEGHRLESLAREKKLAAPIAVDSGGNAALKGLVIDGKLEYEEPFF